MFREFTAGIAREKSLFLRHNSYYNSVAEIATQIPVDPPPSSKIMYLTLSHLQSAIRIALQKGQLCRIYQESLDACWPNHTPEAKAQKIEAFATQNRWVVTHREIGSLGIVAEFQKGE